LSYNRMRIRVDSLFRFVVAPGMARWMDHHSGQIEHQPCGQLFRGNARAFRNTGNRIRHSMTDLAEKRVDGAAVGFKHDTIGCMLELEQRPALPVFIHAPR